MGHPRAAWLPGADHAAKKAGEEADVCAWVRAKLVELTLPADGDVEANEGPGASLPRMT